MAEILHNGEGVEAEALHILEDLKNGKKSISDLLGPLYGDRELTPTINLRPGTTAEVPVAPEAHVSPMDEHNTHLVDNVHPPTYENPEPREDYDLVVIGAGVSGLLSVIMGKALGKRCAMIEKQYMGGDCLNIGCVPSKALISCARRFNEVKNSAEFGVILPEGEVRIDFGHVMARMRKIRASISEHDSVARYARDFCEHIFLGHARFTGDHSIEVAGKTLNFKKAMIATGASASIVPIPGLKDTPHLTNANFFNLTELPPRLSVIGCGPIGLEMAQSLQRFGCQVTCFEAMPQLLPKEDKDAALLLKESLEKDGLVIKLGCKIKRVERVGEGEVPSYCAPWNIYRMVLDVDGQEEVYESEALLNATGRTPNVFDLGLEVVGVDYDNRRGVLIDECFKTTNPDIYSCGDCSTAYKFTHSADFQARLAIRNMFLGDNNRLSQLLIPWATYTEPEVGHVGLYEYELDERGIEYETYKRELAAVDRCKCDGVTEGFVKISVKKGTDEILGATIVGPNAGDFISELTVCIQCNIGCKTLAGIIHPYPTTAESIRQCAAQYNKNIRTPAVNKALEMLLEQQEKK
uniref:Mercuric reductase n=1 Tax=Fibrocapsa japonica TaxID=94617 RepID=A0A7S2UXV1_9STRA|mmetsp:Transcript_15732/g.23127  ORF Transcript_15732/g.23127 Transcript_15732/m.23127 type:complete len:579 (+) Transcript_15732:65-1801(+)